MKEKPRLYPDGLDAPRERETRRSISITVQEVEVYGKKVDFMPANATGVLRCIDYSDDLVPGGWILTDRCVKAKDTVGGAGVE